MILSFHPCIDSDQQVILGDRAIDSEILRLIGRAEAIILPQTCSAALYQACSGSGALLFPSYEARFNFPGKKGQNLLFKSLSLPHPETAEWPNVETFQRTLGLKGYPHGLPFFLKSDRGHEGEGVHLVDGQASLRSALGQLQRKEASGQGGFVSQAFVDSLGNVLRGVIIGTRILTYWKRPDRPGHLITTVSRGASVDHVWRPDLQEQGGNLARSFSEKTGCNLAAIDFVFDLSTDAPSPLFLEVNYSFARRGLGGSERFYRYLFYAVQEWLADSGMDPMGVQLV